MDIVISNLPAGISEKELRGIFEKYGKVEYVHIRKDMLLDKSKVYALIVMAADPKTLDSLKSVDHIGGQQVYIHNLMERGQERRKSKEPWNGVERRGGLDRRQLKDPLAEEIIRKKNSK